MSTNKEDVREWREVSSKDRELTRNGLRWTFRVRTLQLFDNLAKRDTRPTATVFAFDVTARTESTGDAVLNVQGSTGGAKTVDELMELLARVAVVRSLSPDAIASATLPDWFWPPTEGPRGRLGEE